MWPNLANNPRRGLQVLGLFILTLGMGALMLPALGRMDLRGVSIRDVELMRTSTKAAETVAQLGPGGVDAAQMSLYLDFGMLILYALALSAACAVVAARAAERGRTGLAAAGRTIAWLAVVAAALDAVENIALLMVFDGHVDQPWPGIAFSFASVKFAVLAVVIAYLAVGVLSLGRRVPLEESPAAPTD
jgi:hypothetical protein